MAYEGIQNDYHIFSGSFAEYGDGLTRFDTATPAEIFARVFSADSLDTDNETGTNRLPSVEQSIRIANEIMAVGGTGGGFVCPAFDQNIVGSVRLADKGRVFVERNPDGIHGRLAVPATGDFTFSLEDGQGRQGADRILLQVNDHVAEIMRRPNNLYSTRIVLFPTLEQANAIYARLNEDRRKASPEENRWLQQVRDKGKAWGQLTTQTARGIRVAVTLHKQEGNLITLNQPDKAKSLPIKIQFIEMAVGKYLFNKAMMAWRKSNNLPIVPSLEATCRAINELHVAWRTTAPRAFSADPDTRHKYGALTTPQMWEIQARMAAWFEQKRVRRVADKAAIIRLASGEEASFSLSLMERGLLHSIFSDRFLARTQSGLTCMAQAGNNGRADMWKAYRQSLELAFIEFKSND